MNQKTKNILILVLIAVLALFWVTQSPKNRTHFYNSNKHSTKTTQNDKTKEIPADVPIYPGATVNYVHHVDDGLVIGITVTGLPNSKKIVEYYKQELPQKGWELAKKQPLATIKATKGQRLIDIVMVLGDETKKKVFYTIKVTSQK